MLKVSWVCDFCKKETDSTLVRIKDFMSGETPKGWLVRENRNGALDLVCSLECADGLMKKEESFALSENPPVKYN